MFLFLAVTLSLVYFISVHVCRRSFVAGTLLGVFNIALMTHSQFGSRKHFCHRLLVCMVAELG